MVTRKPKTDRRALPSYVSWRADPEVADLRARRAGLPREHDAAARALEDAIRATEVATRALADADARTYLSGAPDPALETHRAGLRDARATQEACERRVHAATAARRMLEDAIASREREAQDAAASVLVAEGDAAVREIIDGLVPLVDAFRRLEYLADASHHDYPVYAGARSVAQCAGRLPLYYALVLRELGPLPERLARTLHALREVDPDLPAPTWERQV